MESASPADLIASKGAAEIATALGVPIGTVRVWKTRNSLPRQVWPELIEAFPDLTLEQLKAMETAA